MKLLFVTRRVDRGDHLAGFIYNWVKHFGKETDELRVISWQEGDSFGLGENISVFHLPTRMNKFAKAIMYMREVWRQSKGVDGIFCHQMPIYTILAAPIAKLRRKRLISWYAHGSVKFPVRLMEKFADRIVTSSEKGFRLPSKKVRVVGQGIDVEKFSPEKRIEKTDKFRLLTVGRISPTKDYESMIRAVDILAGKGEKNITLTIVGDPGLEMQGTYLAVLKEMAKNSAHTGNIIFLGSRPHADIPDILLSADVFINLSKTGSLDKAVLEAMASGCLVITSNVAFAEILPDICMTEKDNPKMLAEKISFLQSLSLNERRAIAETLRQTVVSGHNLDNLVKKIILVFKEA